MIIYTNDKRIWESVYKPNYRFIICIFAKYLMTMKIGFAQRVIVKIIPKTSSGSNSEIKSEVQRLINANKVSIDRSEFAKTPAEKNMLKLAKIEYKEMLRKSK